jgi:hypothetical protein
MYVYDIFVSAAVFSYQIKMIWTSDGRHKAPS